MKVVLRDETHGGVGLGLSCNDTGRDANRRSSHIVGQPHSASYGHVKNDMAARAFGYAVTKFYDEIIRSRGFEPITSVENTARRVTQTYAMATDDERGDIDYLVGNFGSDDTPNDHIYDAVYNALFDRD